MVNIEENSLQQLKKSPDFVKIPANINTSDRSLVKALSVFFALKQYRYTGVIYDYRKNVKQIASDLEISPNNLKSKVKYLLSHDYLFYEGNHLKLCSFDKVCEKMNINTRFVRATGMNVKSIEAFIYAITIKSNLKKQEYAIKIKALIWETEQVKAYINNPELFDATEYQLLQLRARQRSDKFIRKIARKFTDKQNNTILKKWENAQEILWRETYGQFAFVNPRVTLSCAGVARVTTGSNSSSKGHYMTRKLIDYGFITVSGAFLCNVDHVKVNRSLDRFNVWENSDLTPRKAGLFGFRRHYRTFENRINIEF